ncbi:hypothetical protein F4821DRAFT_243059 [Hypoxylon rubiginosum]|uniref:Uncharacterized protein n=1 Tax=Hypoxylon rubiginosum TaxID=110542 RepID=A0ACC0CVE5_9PEZI|nr:hypothetical protein F4821DRAFT_243059 [Hypoxylon rubiginosum]
MSNTAFHPSIFSTSKRSACDRCRSQKLRCPPREKATDRCSRCTRLGVQCTTSFHRPPGRVAKSLSAPSRVRHEIQPSPSSSSSPSTLPSQQNPLVSASLSAGDPALFSPTSLEAHFSTNFPFASSTQSNETLNPSPFTSNYFDDVGTLQISGYVSNAEAELAHNETDADEAHQLNDVSEQFSTTLDCDKRLSHLNLKLSTRLEQCFLGTSQRSPATSLSPSQESDYPVESGTWNSHTLGDILRDTVEFIGIVESHIPSRGSSTTRLNTSRLGTVVQLNLLSVHLQIIATYDRLLQHFYDQLCTDVLTPSSPTSSRQTPSTYGLGPLDLPGMEVAGFQVQQGTLQTKIVLETILHHLAVLERVMGLSMAWKVTDKQRDSPGTGLFNNKLSRLVLEAVGLSTLD